MKVQQEKHQILQDQNEKKEYVEVKVHEIEKLKKKYQVHPHQGTGFGKEKVVKLQQVNMMRGRIIKLKSRRRIR